MTAVKGKIRWFSLQGSLKRANLVIEKKRDPTPGQNPKIVQLSLSIIRSLPFSTSHSPTFNNVTMQKLVLLSFLLTGILVGCSKDNDVEPAATHWDYENPKWDLQGYSECAGLVQSPIDILTSNTVKATLPEINFSYTPFAVKAIDNGHTVQINSSGGNITYNGQKYSLKQFHFHAHSEHTIDGKSSPLEIHFVHQNETTGALVVLGVMLEDGGKDNSAVAQYLKNFPTVKEKEVSTSDLIDPLQLFPDLKKYYNYTGSLTTPPCSQGLNWIVFKEKLKISSAQLAAFIKAYDHNARPVQAMGSRLIFESL
jgi:carbonic anhydrase